MKRPIISPYIHRCTVGSGLMAGNKVSTEVEPFDVEYGSKCEVCGELLARPQDVIVHIYTELTKKE